MATAELTTLTYRPQLPVAYRPPIGLIGCGGITVEHLTAYRQAGWEVAAMCDVQVERARQRAEQFYPDAQVFDDYRDLLRLDRIEVVDIATHPTDRPTIIRDCLLAGKHVLSQKPFVTDIDVGLRLVELAEQRNVRLAVNQNGRWAPHYRFAHSAIQAGYLGEVFAIHLGCHWDHTWVRGTAFENIRHLVLYDYAIHWFDLVRYFMGGAVPSRVYASTARVPGQDLFPNLLGQVLLQFDTAQSSLVFDAGVRYGQRDQTYIAGTRGTLRSWGVSIQSQQVGLDLEHGCWQPALTGRWFPDGFQGTMAELLCAIEENRQPTISAEDNLKSLQVCFAALVSADSGRPVAPERVRHLPD